MYAEDEGMLFNFVQEVERQKSFRKVMEELEQLAATKEMLLKVSTHNTTGQKFENVENRENEKNGISLSN